MLFIQITEYPPPPPREWALKLSGGLSHPTSPFVAPILNTSTVDSYYNELLGPSEITLLYIQKKYIFGLQKQ